jgi:toxin secretion/phage lysis holin
MNVWTWVKGTVAIVVALVAGFWSGLPFVAQLLVYLMALDLLSGLMAGLVTKQLSSDVSFRGLGKKAIILLLLGLAQLIGSTVQIPQLGAAVAGFYCVHEGLSIVENAVRAGVPVPQFLRDALAKLSPEKMSSSSASFGSAPSRARYPRRNDRDEVG